MKIENNARIEYQIPDGDKANNLRVGPPQKLINS